MIAGLFVRHINSCQLTVSSPQSEGTYKGSLDGYFGKGTKTAFDQAYNDNRQIQKYRLLAKYSTQPASDAAKGTVQYYINNLWDDPKIALDGLEASKARVEIENLKSQASAYLAQIDKLKSENEALAGENSLLSQQKDSLNSNLQNKVAENEALSSAKAQLVSEKDALTSKVNIASVIKMKQVIAVGQKVKGSGKVKDENAAKSVDQIKVCFTTLDNSVTKAGVEKFYVRIINPRGETLAIEDMGSGMITNKKTGEEVRFTQVEELDYSNEEAQSCMIWAPTNASFMSGDYTVEVYNKGYLAGTSTLKLK